METHKHSINDILQKSLEHEKKQAENYRTLLKLVEAHSIVLEEYERQMISDKQTHISKVENQLKTI